MSESACGGASSDSSASDKDSLECPTCGKSDFANRRGMKVHHKKTHGESLAGKRLVCDNCSNEFVEESLQRAEKQDHHYCSRECFEEHMKVRDDTVDPVWLEPMYGEDNPAWKGGSVALECDTCGDSYKRPPSEVEKYDNHFCSKPCRAEWMKKRMSAEKHPQWKGGHADYYGANWNRQRRKALERANDTCERCQTHTDSLQKSLEVHHLKRIAWFKENYDKPKWYQRANDLSNLVVLCRDCHNEWEGIPVRPQCSYV